MEKTESDEPAQVVDVPRFMDLQKQINTQRILSKMIDFSYFFVKAVFYVSFLVLINSSIVTANNAGAEIPWIFSIALTFILALEFLRRAELR